MQKIFFRLARRDFLEIACVVSFCRRKLWEDFYASKPSFLVQFWSNNSLENKKRVTRPKSFMNHIILLPDSAFSSFSPKKTREEKKLRNVIFMLIKWLILYLFISFEEKKPSLRKVWEKDSPQNELMMMTMRRNY